MSKAAAVITVSHKGAWLREAKAHPDALQFLVKRLKTKCVTKTE